MEVGLVRHFKVRQSRDTGPISAEEFYQWMEAYDLADVKPIRLDLAGEGWNSCYSSDLFRARKTAETIYQGEIILDPRLREVDVRPRYDLGRQLTVDQWSSLTMDQWKKETGLVEKESQTLERTGEFLEELLDSHREESRILVVCHGLLIRALRLKLLEEGFKGPEIDRIENGQLLLYSRNT